MFLRRAHLVIATLLLGGAAPCPAVDFESVARVLEKNCLECHSGEAPQNSLDLTTRTNLLQGGEEGPAIIPGQPKESLLIQKITGQSKPAMPHKREKLSDAEIALLSQWVQEGASYSRTLAAAPSEEIWWSLRPLTRPALPQVSHSNWVRNPVDLFILARLQKEKMEPAPEAGKLTWLRRVSFDLTGLPPTPEEMSAFQMDNSKEAYERVVDRLLASPRYGERWARHWLDLVHYADTHGNDQDRARPHAWPYRDYVVTSLNQDKPFARFIQEQIAGDILFPAEPEALVATGFLAAGPWDESSQLNVMDDTVDKKIAKYLDRDDMIATTMSTFVSSTVHCARCHNHKFDPISQKDYYNLQAVFAGIDRAERPFDPDRAVHEKRQSILRQLLKLSVKDPDFLAGMLTPAFSRDLAAWEKDLGQAPEWIPLVPSSLKSSPGVQWKILEDHSFLASGAHPKSDTLEATFSFKETGVTAIRLEVLSHESLPMKGPGRQDNGNLALTEISASISPKDRPTEIRPLVLQNPTADFDQTDWTILKALDGNQGTGWSIHPNVGRDHHAVLEFNQLVGFPEGTVLHLKLDQHFNAHLIGRARLSVTRKPWPVRAAGFPEAITKILQTSDSARTPDQRMELAVFFLTDKLQRELRQLPAPQMVYAAAADFQPEGNFKPARIPREIQILRRGDVTKPMGPARPGALSFLKDLKAEFELKNPLDEGERRAALAGWVSDSRNVLTWRSIANRVWHYHFGRGLVDTPNDFGRMGSTPSHPELLDWLALELQANGGSLKKLHRLLVLSATYRQSTRHQAEFASRDAENKWLWRMNRTRLEAEAIHDAILAVSGKIDTTMGGPGAKQFNEKPGVHITPDIDYLSFDMDRREASRRSVYRFIFRTVPDPFMDNMDCPDASQLTPARNTSVTPLQALSLLNNAFTVRQSEHFAARLKRERSSLTQQIERAYELALGRPVREEELKELVPFAQKHGLANVCRVLLNSNEFVFID